MAKHILLINGPNLNLLGHREPHLYGHTTLKTLESNLQAHCSSLSPRTHLSTFQSNHEGEIIDCIHLARYPNSLSSSSSNPTSTVPAPSEPKSEGDSIPPIDFIIINPGGLTHTSVALRDALVGVSLPFVEVHITNVHAREEFRHQSFLSEKAVAVICGLGVYGYSAAVEYAVGHFTLPSGK